MNNFDYKNLTPFKWFVLENFPFIENDFDAINNYHLFSKVVEYLNNTIDSMNLTGEQMENVTNAMTNLQDYVNNYFNNLDVQDEINNKLDEMVEDGTFDEILRPFMYNFQEQINDVNDNVNLLQERMDTFTQLPEGSSGATDAEVNDARIGFNGTVYINLGTAIRTQIGNLNNIALKFIDVSNAEIYSNLISNIADNQISIINANFTDRPGTNTGVLINSQYSANYITQIFIENVSNAIYTRIVNKNTHEVYRNWDIVGVSGRAINLTATNIQAECNSDLNNLKNNIIYGVGNGVSDLQNLPVPNLGGQVIGFGKQTSRTNTDSQIFIDTNSNMYFRLYTANAWQNWQKLINQTEFESCLKFIDITNTSIFSNLIANIDDNRISFISASFTDKPTSNTGVLINTQYSANYMLQIFIEFNITNTIFTRIVNKNTHTVYRDWEIVGVAGKGINLNNDTIQTECNNDLNNLKNNIIYGVANGLSNLQNLPIPNVGGQVIGFGKQMSRTSADSQLYIDNNSNMYFRLYTAGAWQEWKKINSGKSLKNYKYSVLGDSRSTFRGISPWNDHCHYPDSNLTNSNDMWWSIMEKNTGLQRLKIDAFSGSRISTGGSTPHYADGYEFCTDLRINELVDGNTNPDFVFVYGGVNDWYNNINIGSTSYNSNDTNTVANALAITLKKIQTKIPNAKIYVILENYSDMVYQGQYNFPVNSSKIPLGDLIQAQKDVCDKMRIPYIDTSVLNIGYNNITSYLPDYVHGNILFNKELGELISKEIIK